MSHVQSRVICDFKWRAIKGKQVNKVISHVEDFFYIKTIPFPYTQSLNARLMVSIA